MKIYIIVLLAGLLAACPVAAQYAYFATNGTIAYESKFHLQNYIKRNYLNKTNLDVWDNLSVESVVKTGPQEIVTKYTLKFSGDETLFETVKEEYPDNYRNAIWYLPTFRESKTYINHKTGDYLRLLPFGDDEVLLKDTLPTVKWKYTDEYRNIAGYDCRRANGIIQDSIYVVAFFTNQIAIPAGPELIQGLPGTILGLSIPFLNVNMFATSVVLNNDVISSTLTKKKKVVPESKEVIIKKLRSSVYDWLDENEFKKQMRKIFL